MQCFEDSGLGSSFKTGAASQSVDGLPAIKQGENSLLVGTFYWADCLIVLRSEILMTMVPIQNSAVCDNSLWPADEVKSSDSETCAEFEIRGRMECRWLKKIMLNSFDD